MVRQTCEHDLAGYETVDALWQFDLEFYRGIGLNLDPLENASKKAAMPSMRRAASVLVETTITPKVADSTKERALLLLRRTHGKVRELIDQAMTGLDFDDLSESHPEVIAWKERSESYVNPIRVRQSLSQVRFITLGLLRPLQPRTHDVVSEFSSTLGSSRLPFAPISSEHGRYYDHSRPEEVVDQLVMARTGVWFDL